MSSDEIKLEDIQSAIDVLFPEGAVIELRIPKAKMASGKNLGTISGYFQDHQALALDIQRYSGQFSAVYYTLNPCATSLLARSCDKSKTNAEQTTQDSQILKRRWLLLDIDPQRAAGISASDEEKALAKEKTLEIFEFLKSQGWPLPVVGDSGNGYHLLYRLDLENTKEITELLKNVLIGLAKQFDSAQVKVDRSVFNAARIVKAYGSLAKKGEELPAQNRYHRVSNLIDIRGGKVCVSVEQLRTVAGFVAPKSEEELAPAAKPVGGLVLSSHGESVTQDQLREFLEFYNLEIKEEGDTADGQHKFVLTECVFNAEHTGKDAAVFLGADGALGYKCFHNSCAENHWKEFRAELEGLNGKRFSIKGGKEIPLTETAPEETAAEAAEVKKHLQIRKLDLASMRQTEWLWKDRIPLGLITIFSGDAGIGKTLMALDLSARLSTGEKFVDGKENENDPVSTLLLSDEDDPETMIGPRYVVAHGDLNRLYVVEGMVNTHGQLASVKLDKDIEEVREHLITNSDIKLVVIDPLMNYLGSKDAYKPNEVRAVLMPLSRLAQEFNVAVIIIAHHSKRVGVPNALHKIGGSAGIGEVARLGWMFTTNEDKSRTTMSQIKFNLGKFTGVDFTTIGEEIAGMPKLGPQAKIQYVGENVLTADDIVNDIEDYDAKRGRKVSRREQIIKDVFKEQSRRYIADFKDDLTAKLGGCSWDTITRLAKNIGVYHGGQDKDGHYWEFSEEWGTK